MLVDTTTPRPGAWSFPAAVGAAAVLAAGAAGWLVAGATAPAPQPAPPAPVANVGPASLVVPASWVAAPAPPGVRGFATALGLPARALIAFAPRPDRSLVPAELRAGIEGELGRPRRAHLGELAAWTYGPIDSGRTVIQFTVAPTTAGVLGIACTAPQESWSVAMDCHAGLDAVSLEGARAVAPAADLAFRLRLAPAMAALDAQRVKGRAALRRKATRAAAASRLARAHAAAASTLAPVAPRGAPSALVDVLGREAAAYRTFRRATRGRPSRAGARARRNVAASEAALRRALARLRAG